MAELADAQDLGSCVYSCRFDPCYPHQKRSRWPSPSAPLLVRVSGREESHCVLGFACEMRSSRAQQNARAPKSTRKSAETAEGACAEFDPRPPAFVGAGNRSLRIALRFGFRLRNALIKSATKRPLCGCAVFKAAKAHERFDKGNAEKSISDHRAAKVKNKIIDIKSAHSKGNLDYFYA